MHTLGSVILKPGREKSLLRRHPWIFSGAVAGIENAGKPGETVDVFSSDGRWMARGAYSPHSQIRVRIWTFDEQEEITPAFFEDRLKRAIQSRNRLNIPEESSAYRIVNAESDGIPGFVVDRYGNTLVCQFLSSGAEAWKSVIIEMLNDLLDPSSIYERSDSEARKKEGLEPKKGLLTGNFIDDAIEIREGPLRFLVDIKTGQKTGFYLDQRDNRALVARFAADARVLNGFAYTGGFGIRALHSGALEVTNVETSPEALHLLDKNIELNGLNRSRGENVKGDVFRVLRTYRDSRREFDLIILDPPKFAEAASHIKSASRGYKDINILAFKLLSPGGVLFTFSCSNHVEPALFQKIVADAAVDAGRMAQIIHQCHQAPDHPVSLNFPEGRYLKGIVARVW